MKLEAQSVKKTLDLARTLSLLGEAEVRDVMEAFDAQYPLAAAMKLADTLHVHVKVDAVHALPAAELRAAGGSVENEKDGYVKYAFPSGMNLIFSSINVSEDDLRATPESEKRKKPFLDHYGIDMRAETPDVKATFDAIPQRAKELGWATAAQGGDGKLVYCCHVTVSAKHWVYPREAQGRMPPCIEVAYGPLAVQSGKSGCDLRPSDPSLGLAAAPACGAGAEVANGSYYQRADLGKFGEIGNNRKDLADKFFGWYTAVFEDGALDAKQKSLIALAVAHAVQCPYCIDAYTNDATAKGATLDQLTEVVHVAAAIRGGASLVHGVQMRGHVHDKGH